MMGLPMCPLSVRTSYSAPCRAWVGKKGDKNNIRINPAVLLMMWQIIVLAVHMHDRRRVVVVV
jgi:hypothetical protein